MCSKGFKTEAVFTKTGLNIELNINFLQNSLFGIQHTSSSEFSMSQSTFETHQWLDGALSYFF